jgi:hypothetical protein
MPKLSLASAVYVAWTILKGANEFNPRTALSRSFNRYARHSHKFVYRTLLVLTSTLKTSIMGEQRVCAAD